MEAKTLDAMCERIIPLDQDPGASWAGAVEFIDRKLVGFHRADQQLYRNGLVALEESCRALYGGEFGGLDAVRQDSLLHELEEEKLPGKFWQEVSQKDFFSHVASHTMQGFYGGPRHGGNREAISWRMLGLPEPPLRSRRPVDAPWSKPAKPAGKELS